MEEWDSEVSDAVPDVRIMLKGRSSKEVITKMSMSYTALKKLQLHKNVYITGIMHCIGEQNGTR